MSVNDTPSPVRALYSRWPATWSHRMFPPEPRKLPRCIGHSGRKRAHWIHIVFPLSVLLGSTVSSPKVEKNCSISFCSMSFLFSASSFARSAFRILISIIVNFFLSWSSSSWRLIISVSKVKFRCSKLDGVREGIRDKVILFTWNVTGILIFSELCLCNA